MKLGNRTGLLNTKQLYISYEIRKEIIRNEKKKSYFYIQIKHNTCHCENLTHVYTMIKPINIKIE